MNSFQEFQLLIGDLEKNQIRYVLIGGVAMAFHDEPRFTRDIDLLLSNDDFAGFKKLVKEKGYIESAEPWTFKNIELTMHRFLKVENEESMLIDVLIPSSEEIMRIIDNADIAESENGIVRIASKKDLIRLKSIRNSKQDQADIERLKS